jgi:DNA polymerase
VVVANVPQPALFVAYDTPEDSDDIDRRISELEALKKGVERCTRCAELASTRTQIVFGVGPLDPELCFIGEAPGYDEDKNGEPFVGAAGQLLTRIITACGLSREEVYICNVLRCRPPGNRTPLLEEADNCREYLEKTIELVRPKFLCVLGNTPLKVFLGLSRGITQMRGTWHDYRGIPVMCTFHPSYLLRKPEDKKLVWDDMKALLTRMGRTIPGKQS